jgi:DNA-binding NarL/FixJ family response regulator
VLWGIEAQVRALGDRGPSSTLEECAAASDLSGRELAVLQLLARGLTAQAIGRRLGASPRTIQKHLQHIYQKLGVNDRMAAVRVATARQLLVVSPAGRGTPAREA